MTVQRYSNLLVFTSDFFLAKLFNKKGCGLYRADELLILQNVNRQQIDLMRKNVIKIFKDIVFSIDVETNLKIVDFLDITFNLNNGTHRRYKKPNDLLLYINKSSNHPPQIINQLPKVINKRLSRNSSNEEVFNSSKYQYKKTLRDSGYTDFIRKFNKTSNNHTKKNRQRNIIWFNPPFSKAVSTNVGKRFLQLLRHHFPPSNKLHKIFNNNTVKVKYCCTQNVASIIKSHNKKLINTSIKETLPCNCRKKHGCLLDGKCWAENIVYKLVASVDGYSNKVYLGTAEGDFKQRFYNHRMSFNNECHSKDTALSKYVWEVKRKLKLMPSLKRYTIKSVPAYSNISKKCQLCLQEKFEILNYPSPN